MLSLASKQQKDVSFCTCFSREDYECNWTHTHIYIYICLTLTRKFRRVQCHRLQRASDKEGCKKNLLFDKRILSGVSASDEKRSKKKKSPFCQKYLESGESNCWNIWEEEGWAT